MNTPNEEMTEPVTLQVKQKTATPLFVLLCISVVFNACGLLGIWAVSSDTNTVVQRTQQIVEDIERRNSPAALADEQSQLDALAIQIICAELSVFEAAVTDLIAEGVLPETARAAFLEDDC